MSTLISDKSKTSTALYALEQKWLTENREKYAGQWVALVGDNLLSHGADAKAVYAEAREKAAEFGDAPPLVVLLEKESGLPFYKDGKGCRISLPFACFTNMKPGLTTKANFFSASRMNKFGVSNPVRALKLRAGYRFAIMAKKGAKDETLGRLSENSKRFQKPHTRNHA